MEPARQVALLPSVARAARTALLAWGGISLAAISGAAVVYAHGGFGGQVVAIEEAEPAPAPQQVVAAAAPQLSVAAVAPQQPVAAPAQKRVRIIETTRTPIERPVTVAALPAPAVPSPAAVAAQEILAAQPEPLEARLPKPRPEPPLVTASIPQVRSEPVAKPSTAPVAAPSTAPRAVNIRRPVYVGGYPVQRPRYYYRYRAPVF